MLTKTIGSTQAQNNFGRVLDDVTHNRTRYIVERRGSPQVIILSLEDFVYVLNHREEREALRALMREVRPRYEVGTVLETNVNSPGE
ncbi:MAG: type II toxin-antitoxin system Phd/YefM family antitoxin [Anaerolineae bacterium]|nr:type II toxin-antitoxin system Phd/YefM family antitoxin [Anaerolineae bacterium]